MSAASARRRFATPALRLRSLPASSHARSTSLAGLPTTTLARTRSEVGADDRDRTGDLVLTKDVLCQLSYIGLRPSGYGRQVGLAFAYRFGATGLVSRLRRLSLRRSRPALLRRRATYPSTIPRPPCAGPPPLRIAELRRDSLRAWHARWLAEPKLARRASEGWSGRRGSNPRPTAWKAVTLPLSYSRLRARSLR